MKPWEIVVTVFCCVLACCPVIYFFVCAAIDYYHTRQMKILAAIPKMLSTIHLRKTVIEEIKEVPQQEQPVE